MKLKNKSGEPAEKTPSRRRSAASRPSLLEALDAGPRCQDLPPILTQWRKDWDELKSFILAEKLAGDDPWEINYFDARVAMQCWAWAAEGKMTRFADCDRMGQSYGGPVYTCRGYGWPKMPAGYPCLPLLQIDLGKASELCGVDLGDGLVQLFDTGDVNAPGQGYRLRTIPAHRVNESQMTPLPRWTQAQLSKLRHMPHYFYNGELSPDYLCFQISAFSKKRFQYYGPDYGEFEFGAVCSKAEKQLDPEKLRWFKNLYEKVDQGLLKLCKYRNEQRGGTHLFGSFKAIQYSSAQVPVPLFCVDGNREDDSCEPFSNRQLENRFCLGDSGNGQILIYRDKRGRPSLAFSWSCY